MEVEQTNLITVYFYIVLLVLVFHIWQTLRWFFPIWKQQDPF